MSHSQVLRPLHDPLILAHRQGILLVARNVSVCGFHVGVLGEQLRVPPEYFTAPAVDDLDLFATGISLKCEINLLLGYTGVC